MESIEIPATISKAIESLNGIEGLITAKAWERSAIVYAFTEDGQGRRTDLGKTLPKLSITDFADLGIVGLTSRPTVQKYRQAWLDGGGDPNIEPGTKQVEIPSGEFPPDKENLGSRVSADPTKAVEQLLDKHGEAAADAMAHRPEVIDAVADDDKVVREVNHKAAQRHDTGEREPRVKKEPDYDQLFQDAVAEIVYRLADRNAGRWEPNEWSLAHLHFLRLALDNPMAIEPGNDLVDEITAYLQQVAQ